MRKLYKYRSLESLEFTLDILMNERLYCAEYRDLNDPLEGAFYGIVSQGALGRIGVNEAPIGGSRRSIDHTNLEAYEGILTGGTRVCSLSASLSETRLWSYYADGHRGIAIEIELPEETPQLYEVTYGPSLEKKFVGVGHVPDAQEVLSAKTAHWSHENEFRLITTDEYFSISGKIRSVYMGWRVSDLMAKMLDRVLPNDIPIYRTRMNSKDARVVEEEKFARTFNAPRLLR